MHSMVEGECGYIVMADFASASFRDAGFEYGAQYTSFPTPGSAGYFDFLADTFTLPVGAVHDDAARAWLNAVSSQEGQKALSLAKGSIPARTDTVAADYPAYQRTAIASLLVGTIVPSLANGVAAKPAWTEAISDAVEKFGHDGHPDALVNALVSAATNAFE